MSRAAFAIPGDIDQPTGGYAYDRRLLALLPGMGIDVEHVPLPRAFPRPSGMDLRTAAQALAGVDASTVLLIDGLAYGAFSTATLAAIPHRIVALVHHPLAFETGIGPDRAAALLASETQALGRSNHIIVTSSMTAQLLRTNLQVPAAKITVAEPGTDPASRAVGSDGTLSLLAVGSIVPRKGFTVLVEALADLNQHDWRLTIAGAASDHDELARLELAIAAAGLAGRVSFAGAVDAVALDRLYAQADVFVMSSLFEGYGMALAEAMARGLPIVCTTGGAALETVPDAAAVKVPPGNTDALRTALRRVIKTPALRLELADAAWAAGQALPRWEDTARIVATVLEDVAR